MTEIGIAADDPHGSPCHIARWLTYYAERQNGLPGTLNLDPDGQAWSTRKHALPGNAVRDTFTHRTEHVSVTLINPMSLKDAKKWAQQTLNDFEAGAHPDPLLNVHDDANHSDGGQITCKTLDRTKVDCTTVVTFSEDAYTYSTAPSGQVYVNYKADRVMWTERMRVAARSVCVAPRPIVPRGPEGPDVRRRQELRWPCASPHTNDRQLSVWGHEQSVQHGSVLSWRLKATKGD